MVLLTGIGLALATKLPLMFIEEDDDDIAFSSVSRLNLSENSILNKSTSTFHDETLKASSTHHVIGVVAALCSIVFASSVYIIIRKAKEVHHSVIMFNFGWVAIVEMSLITALIGGYSLPANWFEWLLIVALMCFSFFGQLLLTRSLQLENAGAVAIVRSAADILLAFVWQIWFFGDMPDIWSISGAFLVTTCLVLTSLRKGFLSTIEKPTNRLLK